MYILEHQIDILIRIVVLVVSGVLEWPEQDALINIVPLVVPINFTLLC
jgi:hypothetical protein